MNRARTYSLLALLSLGLAACSSAPISPAAATSMSATSPAPDTGPAQAAPSVTTGPAVGSKVAMVVLPAHLDPNSSISLRRSVYFDFDVYSIRSDDSALIERHGKYLSGNPALAILIEGHTDERGGAEYNLALGQKRAESVLRALKIYGARDSQMEAVSWGESKPRATGHDEAAWAENRRADLRYPAK
jgi:peptidoglycan-associated lipoprotein